MQFFKKIFARIWACWGIISFIATFLLIFIPSMFAYLVPGRNGQRYFIWISKLWMNIWLPMIGCPVKVTGQSNFKKNKTYVTVFNHNALLDVPLSAPFVPGPNKTIAKSSFSKIPLFGLFYSKGSVLVDRKNDASRRKSYEEMREVLSEGIHMSIYPEGTRNRGNEPLKPFFDGAFKLAIDAGKDIIPCVIFGTANAMPIHKVFYLFPTRLRMHFLPPVSSSNITISELKEKVFKLMHDYYVQENEKK
jgi:1-acyl-sn-glycerol-3-phosphate acyltransferase